MNSAPAVPSSSAPAKTFLGVIFFARSLPKKALKYSYIAATPTRCLSCSLAAAIFSCPAFLTPRAVSAIPLNNAPRRPSSTRSGSCTSSSLMTARNLRNPLTFALSIYTFIVIRMLSASILKLPSSIAEFSITTELPSPSLLLLRSLPSFSLTTFSA